ncbi:MAG: hypothetical protein HYX55_00485 [Chloroflexi bacterium]|nr:hypothetical protein [Chloroflexota bacterium]
MPSNAVPGFLPSRFGFRFANRWPSNPARRFGIGRLSIPIGDTARGLCGGMAFAARDRFQRGEDAPADIAPPAPGEGLFKEIVDRQFDSFGRLFVVPLRFWLAVAGSQARRDRGTVRDAWPAIKAAVDNGEPPMVGLVRLASWNPLAVRLGHQVVAFRYDESATGITIWIYDPNHPGDDDVRLTVERRADGTFAMGQSTGEALIGLLSLPFRRA